MKYRIMVLVWLLTGWVPPEWSRRDNEGRLRYWTALIECQHIIQEAMKQQ